MENAQATTAETDRRPPPMFLTPASIALRLNIPVSRVAYILAHRDIPPVAYAGDIGHRLYHWRALPRVKHESNAIDARQAERLASRRANREAVAS